MANRKMREEYDELRRYHNRRISTWQIGYNHLGNRGRIFRQLDLAKQERREMAVSNDGAIRRMKRSFALEYIDRARYLRRNEPAPAALR